MNRAHTLLALPGVLVLGLLTACKGGGGGSSTPPPTPSATTLGYTDPTSGTWQLKKNVSSTSTHLVLDLVASGAGTGAGVAVQLSVNNAKATWAKVQAADTEYVRNGSVITLGAGTQALKGKVTSGTLQFAVSQKGLASAPTLNGTVAQVALDLVPGTAPGAITLGPVAGKTKMLAGTGTISDITVTVGILSAN